MTQSHSVAASVIKRLAGSVSARALALAVCVGTSGGVTNNAIAVPSLTVPRAGDKNAESNEQLFRTLNRIPNLTKEKPLNIARRDMASRNKVFDPCSKIFVDAMSPPSNQPKALDSVREHDPELYKQIHTKVTDPRYIGQLGNITVSTHDKHGRVNGCVFVQNVPYWEAGAAAQALVAVNKKLAKRGLRLQVDSLNGAGRTLAQEEAIAWRNTGLHAKVGKSNHGFGRAVDFQDNPGATAGQQLWDDAFVNATLHAHGWRQGDSWGPIKNDLHHWSFIGPGPAMDGPPPLRTFH